MTEDLLLNFRKIRNWLRKHSSNIGDENNLRKLLFKLYYYDINNDIPIAIIKNEDEINWDLFPLIFKLIKRDDIINIYNKEVRSNYFKELKIVDITTNNYQITKNSLKISLKTFRPFYEDNWKELAQKVNNIEFTKQTSYYSIYLKLFIKLQYFPTFDDFIKFIFNKYQTPLHKDIKIIFDNIEESYKDVKDYIKTNNLNYKDIKDIIIKSTNISTRKTIQ